MRLSHRSAVQRRVLAVIATLLLAPTTGFFDHHAQALAGLDGLIYVTDRGANRVWAIDASSGAILASNATEVRPIGVEKTNGKVYTANETSGSVSVFDACTLDPIKVIPVVGCSKPHHTDISDDGSRLYVACLGTNKIAVVDTASDEVDALWTSGAVNALTHQPWATKDGDRVWATNMGSNDITELDAHTGVILRTVPTGANRLNPVETVTPANAKLAYVSIASQNKLQVFDLLTNTLVEELDVPAPENLMISGNGKRILASKGGLTTPHTSASIIDLTVEPPAVQTVQLEDGSLATHNDLTNNGRYGFVSLQGPPRNGVAVIDMDAASVHAFYEIPGASSPHGVRWAPSCGS